MRRGSLAFVFCSAFAALAALDLYAISSGRLSWRVWTKPPLMLVLAGVLFARYPRLDAPQRWLAAGLGWSAAGDTILLGTSDAAFVLGTLAFAGAHLSFIVAFARAGGGAGFVRRLPWVALPYLAAWLGTTLLLAPHMGVLAFVAIPYGFLLMVMALAALDLIGRIPLRSAILASVGAALFMSSDSNIAIARFDPSLAPPHVDVLIMALYLVAQSMITAAFLLPGTEPRAAGTEADP